KIFEKANTFLREERIAHRKGFVDYQDIRVHMSNNGKRQTHEHATGIVLDRLIDKLANTRKSNYGVHARLNGLRRKAVDGAIEQYILATGKFRIKTGTQLQQGGYPALNLD